VIEELRKPDAEVLPLHGDMDTTDGPTRVVAEAVARFGLEAFLSLLSSAWARAYSDQQRARRGEQRRHQPAGGERKRQGRSSPSRASPTRVPSSPPPSTWRPSTRTSSGAEASGDVSPCGGRLRLLATVDDRRVTDIIRHHPL